MSLTIYIGIVSMNIITANTSHISHIALLFDAYRVFYQQATDLKGATDFISNNLEHGQSTIFLAQDDKGESLGFVQLYPSWESVTMSKRWVLYDLYVCPKGRKQGIATLLMNRAKRLAQATQAKYITLETATDNKNAQALYESLGYIQDNEFLTYSLEIDSLEVDSSEVDSLEIE
ncbi:MAG: ribosomal protein S18 acetylase RimI-like enzyme [Psychrobacter glaciei]|jgi:ribosomal protein S18 acetylase RimI-like enzyme